MTVNTALFDKYRKSNGYTMQSLADALGISRSTLTRKKKSKSEFTYTEIERCCVLLNIKSKNKKAIFFVE